VATSYLHLTSVSAGAAAENAAEKKEAKEAGLAASFTFLPLAFESLGPINAYLSSQVNSVKPPSYSKAFLP